MSSNNNSERQVVKDLSHMWDYLESAKNNISLVENFLKKAIEREKEARRKDDE